MELRLKNTGKADTIIVSGKDVLSKLSGLTSDYTKTVLVTDEGARQKCLEIIRPYLSEGIETIVLNAGEDSKDLNNSQNILDKLQQLGCDRKSLVIGLGGGVVNDVAGFVASIYMRGIDWVMLPTTLTAQADASIGGKTGVNLGKYKNMIGSFWPPKAVLIYPGFLKSLPENHLKNGLAEIIKMGIIYDKQILDYVDRLNPSDLLSEELIRASELAVKAKVQIVNKDTFESGERKLLNFGHTIGHAVEINASLLHGEAISIGMVAEAKLAELEDVAEAGLSNEVANLLQKFGLPVSTSVSIDEILEIIAADKKNIGNKVNWTLPKKIGEGTFNYVAKDENIREAIEAVINS